jgi:hypothetical protein
MAMARGSIGLGASRGWRISTSTMVAASAKARAVSPVPGFLGDALRLGHGQFVVVEVDGLDRALRQGGRGGKGNGHRLTHAFERLAGEDREGQRAQHRHDGVDRQDRGRAEIGRGVHRVDPGQLERGGGIDAPDPRPRDGAAQEGEVKRRVERNVIGVGRAPRHERRVLPPPKRPADHLGPDVRHRRAEPSIATGGG